MSTHGLYSCYMCATACMCACSCMCRYTHVMWRADDNLGCHFSGTTCLYLGTRTLIDLNLSGWRCWLTSKLRDLLVSTSPATGFRSSGYLLQHWFLCGLWESASGSCGFKANILLAEISVPSPLPHTVWFWEHLWAEIQWRYTVMQEVNQ